MNLAAAQQDLFNFPLAQLQMLARDLRVSSNAKKDELAWLLARKLHSKKAHMSSGYQDKNILVTGGAGFIGSNLVDTLLESGAKNVRVLDNLSTGHKSNLTRAAKYSNFEFVKGDIRSLKTCKKASEGIDIVFHEAALVSVPTSMEKPVFNNNNNITGTLNMLIAAAKSGVKRFVYASSAAVYGLDPDLPKKESMHRHYPSPYALSKGVDEDYATLWAYNDKLGNGMTCIGLRYFNVYGPRQDPKSPYSGVISIFSENIVSGKDVTIFGDGNQTRDFVFVADIVQANILSGLYALEKGESRVYNVGTGSTETLLNLFDCIEKIIGKKVAINFAEERSGDIKHSSADISKLQDELNYSSKYTLYEGLQLLLHL